MIPIHDFSKDDERSIPFKFIPLNQRADYDITHAHRHNYYEIFLFAQGGGNHEIDFNNYDVADNSIHFVSPGQVHRLQRAPYSHGSILLFSRDFYYLGSGAQFSLFEYAFLNGNAAGSPIVNLSQQDFESLLSLSQIMGSEELSVKESAEIIRSYLHVFLLKCRQFSEATVHYTQEVANPIFANFNKLLEQNFRSQHTVSFYADELAVSSRKLIETCQLYCDKSPTQLIRERLILEARRLLLHSKYSIKEIAYFLGFEDPAYFNRFFRKNEQISAGSYRKAGVIVP